MLKFYPFETALIILNSLVETDLQEYVSSTLYQTMPTFNDPEKEAF